MQVKKCLYCHCKVGTNASWCLSAPTNCGSRHLRFLAPGSWEHTNPIPHHFRACSCTDRTWLVGEATKQHVELRKILLLTSWKIKARIQDAHLPPRSNPSSPSHAPTLSVPSQTSLSLPMTYPFHCLTPCGVAQEACWQAQGAAIKYYQQGGFNKKGAAINKNRGGVGGFSQTLVFMTFTVQPSSA